MLQLHACLTFNNNTFKFKADKTLTITTVSILKLFILVKLKFLNASFSSILITTKNDYHN